MAATKELQPHKLRSFAAVPLTSSGDDSSLVEIRSGKTGARWPAAELWD